MLHFDYIDEALDDGPLFTDTTTTTTTTKGTKKMVNLGEYPISEKMKVIDLKKYLYSIISSSSSSSSSMNIRSIPESYNHIRLRDIRKPNEFLRNDRILNRVLLGIIIIIIYIIIVITIITIITIIIIIIIIKVLLMVARSR